MIKVSIIVPVYNTQKYIERCLSSLVSQSMRDIEIIIVDDCGSDKAMEVAKAYAARDSRIQIVRNVCNRGLLHTRIIGGKYAKGEYICYVDSDDYISLDTCLLAYEAALRQGADVVAFGAVCEGFYRRTFYTYKESIYADSYKLLFPTRGSFTPYVWNKLYKRELICSVDILLEGAAPMNIAEDVLKSFVLLSCAKRVVGIPHRLYVYCANNASSTQQSPRAHIAAYSICVKNIEYALAHMNNVDINKAKKLFRVLQYLKLNAMAKQGRYLYYMCASLKVWFRFESLIKIALYICSGIKRSIKGLL
ncbi:glycosyltransferase family 2 protein [Helicobacter marmotae]|uniref:glycosyltransferase family 2 protein n=1 Tax=Helicobacter marmotae TaxID=152490 RepID=UPI00131542D2|nr:glycosyltransferase family 2 protein [Helicobacter marmotae]